MSFIGCMLAHELELKRHKFPVAVEGKLDGFRIVCVDGKGYTRNGETYESLKHHAKALAEVVGPGVHVDCEFIASNWNETSKLLKRKNNLDFARIKEEVTAVVFDVYDAKTIKNKVPYSKRRAEVKRIVREVQGVGAGFRFEHSECFIAKTESGIRKALEKALAKKLEGVMVKALDGAYEVKRSHAWGKLKPFKDITVTIIGAEEGRGLCPNCSTVKAKADKRSPEPDACTVCAGNGEVTKKGVLGAFLCKMERGAEIFVGGGFTAEQRKEFWGKRKSLLGKKIDVKVADDQGNGIVARFPVFMRFRSDI